MKNSKLILLLIIVVLIVGFFVYKHYNPRPEKLDVKNEALLNYESSTGLDNCGKFNLNDPKEQDLGYSCFKQAIKDCAFKKVLFEKISDNQVTQEYSYMAVIGLDDELNCVFQNTYYKKDLSAKDPVIWINSCNDLNSTNLLESCKLQPEVLN